jgi:hypothetical protein
MSTTVAGAAGVEGATATVSAGAITSVTGSFVSPLLQDINKVADKTAIANKFILFCFI